MGLDLDDFIKKYGKNKEAKQDEHFREDVLCVYAAPEFMRDDSKKKKRRRLRDSLNMVDVYGTFRPAPDENATDPRSIPKIYGTRPPAADTYLPFKDADERFPKAKSDTPSEE